MSPRTCDRAERGSVTPLIIGFFLIASLLVAVVVDASAAFLQRQRLNSLADAAALAATDGIQGDQVYTHGLGELARIDPAAAQQYAAAACAAVRRQQPGLVCTVRTDVNRVIVRVQAPLELPLSVPGVGRHTMVSGTGASVVVVAD